MLNIILRKLPSHHREISVMQNLICAFIAVKYIISRFSFEDWIWVLIAAFSNPSSLLTSSFSEENHPKKI